MSEKSKLDPRNWSNLPAWDDLPSFMKTEEVRGYWPDPETYDHEPWPLQLFIEQHKKRKKRKSAA